MGADWRAPDVDLLVLTPHTHRLSNGRYAGGAKVPYTSGLKSASGFEPFLMYYA